MDIEVVKIYVVCDDILQGLGVADDPQAQMKNAEVSSTTSDPHRYMGYCIQLSSDPFKNKLWSS
jgi:hypothetical protein